MKFLTILVLPVLAAGFFTFQTQNTPTSMLTVKKDNYEFLWKTVDSLEQKGLPESAQQEVQAIYERAQQDENAPQIVKAVVHLAKYKKNLSEAGEVAALSYMEEEIEKTEFPVEPILQSYLAEFYHNYLIQNQWRIRERTEVVDSGSEDIATWTLEQLNAKVVELHAAAIESKELKRIANSEFDVLLIEKESDASLRPTMYDVLIFRALEQFSNEATFLAQPANAFYLNNERAFLPPKGFIKTKFRSDDTDSYEYKSLLLFQELLQFHLQDDDPSALIDANLKRLKYVHQKATLSNKDELYLNALKDLQKEYAEHPMVTEILYQLAYYHFQQSDEIDSETGKAKVEHWRIAHEYAEQAIKAFPESFGAKYAQQLLTQIEAPKLNLQVEQVNLPDQPYLIKIDHSNVETAHFRVVEMSYDDYQKLNRSDRDQQLEKLRKKKAVKKWTIDLPQTGDYRQHSVEVEGDDLELGTYILMIASDGDFKSTSTAHYVFFAVSEIGYWHRTNRGEGSDFVVFNRRTGEPMAGVIAEFFSQQYDSRIGINQIRSIGTKTTDKNGFLNARNMGERYFQVKFKKGQDELFFGDGFSNYRRGRSPQKTQQTHFFLDRAIYRPGQTMHFKALVLEKNEKNKPYILPNEKVSITFRDANYQVVETLELKTNEYGTVSGKLQAPKGGLLGNMSLESSAGKSRHTFSVEEYKRPKFAVKFNPITESYKLGEEVKVVGQATAFAGNQIDGAKVQYRVERQVRYPWVPWWRRSYYAPAAPTIIKNGETQTKADGTFEIDFEAIPDPSTDQKNKPEFTYMIYADVVDITGETHSAQTQMRVGYIALAIDLKVPERIPANELDSLTINTLNLNNEFEAAEGKVVIERLEMPKQTFIDRYWGKPDQEVLSEREFKKAFPQYAYQKEDEAQSWETTATVVDKAFNTAETKTLDLSNINWEAGAYKLTIQSKDKYGQAVEREYQFMIYDWDKKDMALKEMVWQSLDQATYEPGETANLRLATSLKSLPVLVETEKDGDIIQRKWATAAQAETLKFKIREEDRGNFIYHVSYGALNRSYNKNDVVLVPWSNKELTIEYATFRDKLRPGQDEEWQLKISGPKGEKVAAELVAAMYDASLDQITRHNWTFNPYPTNSYSYLGLYGRHFNAVNGQSLSNYRPNSVVKDLPIRRYPRLQTFGYSYGDYSYRLDPTTYEERIDYNIRVRGMSSIREETAVEEMSMAAPRSAAPPPPPPPPSAMMKTAAGLGEDDAKNGIYADEMANVSDPEVDLSDVAVRTNLDETVFFMPELRTDADGNIIVSFQMNEALTKWKFLAFAHTKELKFATSQQEVVTQKELMVQPNAPRFMREGDQIVFTAKVSNLTEEVMNGSTKIELLNALTLESVDHLFELEDAQQPFTAEAGQSARLAWQLKVPNVTEVPALTHRVVAKAGNFSDGEESTLPILTNRMLVTETMPMPIRGKKREQFNFASLANSAQSSTLAHQSLTLEFTSNPAWYAVQALPYLMEYPHDCIEQIFNRYYANSLATSVADAHPRVKEVFESWKESDADAMLSNLSKNEELKYALLTETPWVMQAQSEEKQKQNIALLFDLNRMAAEQNEAIEKLLARQLGNGGFSWFLGGRQSWYMTQYIVEGIGHLDRLDVQTVRNDDRLKRILDRAIQFIDNELVNDYNKRQQNWEKKDQKADRLTNMAIHYLYARSFFLEYPIEGELEKVVDFYIEQANQHWLNKSLYEQGLLALGLERMKETATPQDIVKSLKERSFKNKELGMYWRYDNGYYWYQMPIETHALMIEVFDEVAQDEKAVEELKVWLLKNKQTTNWKTTKATAAAVYALLSRGDNWLLEDQMVEVEFDNAGNPEIHTEKIKLAQQDAEVGTNYFRASWTADEITSDMATINVRNPNKNVAWGAIYWQYFEQLDKIKTFEETPLKLKKSLFKEINTDRGQKLQPIDNKARLQPGDKIIVRIELRVDRAMEYVHMKDARASGFEPINVLSQYKYQDGLGYYESPRDVATDFFFSYLRPGTYVFEYPLRVVHEGDFSNGVTTIQSMYAPEFTSHSEGVRVKVE
ncbi:MAG: alpha-2-macroglobulin family protein [Bacteroidota bacterium]